jgi:hypothetical protein
MADLFNNCNLFDWSSPSRNLYFCADRWDQCFFDGVGMDPIVDFAKCALQIPLVVEACIFFVF